MVMVTDLEKYREEQAQAKLLAFDIAIKSRDLAWAHVRQLEWQVELLERDLAESKSFNEELKLRLKQNE